jgi:hypothetical protein
VALTVRLIKTTAIQINFFNFGINCEIMKKLLFFALIIGFATSCSSSKQTTAGTGPATQESMTAKHGPQPIQPAQSTARQQATKVETRYTR